MTIYHVDRCYKPDDTIHYIVSPYDLIGTVERFVKYYGFMGLIDFLKMSRFSEKRANQLVYKMNKLYSNKGDVNMNETKINELTDKISKARAILNDLTAQLEAEKNKVEKKKEPSIEDRWKPNEDERCFVINGLDSHIEMLSCYKAYLLNPFNFYNNYNSWKTETRAVEVFNKTKLLWLMEQIHDILCPYYKPDWNNENCPKYVICFDFSENKWHFGLCYVSYKNFTFFDTEEHAKQACKILNDMGVKPI